MAKKLNIKEFPIEDVPLSCTWIITGPPGSGKTSFIEEMAYFNKHKYPVAKVVMGTEDGYKRMCSIFGHLFTNNYYEEEEEKKYIMRQRTCCMENGKGYPGNYSINILDDVSDDPKIFKTKVMRGIFKNGSQHWAQLFMLGSQYAIDLGPDTRKAVSYVAIGREPEMNERKKLYENFGGICGSFENFCELMDAITGDYTFLIFQKRTQSNNLEDCIFYYKTKNLKNKYPNGWNFGCKEYREWNKTRYDPAFKEVIQMD